MTTQELINYYAGLLIIQYLGKPKAFATIQATAKPFIMNQLPVQVENAFDPATAVGVQLDIIGKYTGVTRYGYVNGQPVTLSDSDFRTLIQFATLTNSAGSSLATIQQLLNQFFPGEVFVFDYRNMHMSYLINSTVGSQDLVHLLVSEGLLPRPMAVQMAVIYAPIINTFFGMRTYLLPAANVSPFNSYASYNMLSPWLKYADSI